MGNYPGSNAEVKDPIVLEPNPSNEFIDLFINDFISIFSIASSAFIVWVTRRLRQRVEEISKRVEDKGTDFNLILPPEEVARVKEILAQLAIIYEADRVTLGIFHNGVIGAKGAHYDKVAIISGYNSPGVIPLPELYKDVDAITLMEDFKPLYSNEGREVFLSKEDAPYSCSLYMTRRDIFHLWNRFLSYGNIDIGILGFHWCSPWGKLPLPPEGSRGYSKAKELVREIMSIIQITKDRQRILG